LASQQIVLFYHSLCNHIEEMKYYYFEILIWFKISFLSVLPPLSWRWVYMVATAFLIHEHQYY
jgi:hypothetical protein